MNAGLEPHIERLLIVGARVSGIMIFAPFFGSPTIAPRIRAGLAMALTAAIYPVAGPKLSVAPAASAWKLVGGELVFGLLIGLTLQFVFEAMSLAGQIAGFQVGHTLANLINPLSDAEVPILSNFYQSIALLIFLQLNVHLWILRGVAKSFEYCPPGLLTITARSAELMGRAAGGIFVMAVQIAIPTLLATMLIDLALGFLGKASPQLPVLFVGISAKNLAAFLVLMGTLKFWPGLLDKYFGEALAMMERLLRVST